MKAHLISLNSTEKWKILSGLPDKLWWYVTFVTTTEEMTLYRIRTWRSVCKVNFLCNWFVSLKKHHYEEVESVQNRVHSHDGFLLHFYEVRISSPFFWAKRPAVTVCYLILWKGRKEVMEDMAECRVKL